MSKTEEAKGEQAMVEETKTPIMLDLNLNVEDILDSIVADVKVRESNLLGVCKNHPVKVINVEFTNSFLNADGTEKSSIRKDREGNEVEIKYKTPSPVVSVLFGSMKNEGVITHRFHLVGFLHTEDLTEEEMTANGLEDIQGFACLERDGEFHRIPSAKKTTEAVNILGELCGALGMEQGKSSASEMKEFIKRASDDNYLCNIDVVDTKDKWNGVDPQLRVRNFKLYNDAGEEASKGFLLKNNIQEKW